MLKDNRVVLRQEMEAGSLFSEICPCTFRTPAELLGRARRPEKGLNGTLRPLFPGDSVPTLHTFLICKALSPVKGIPCIHSVGHSVEGFPLQDRNLGNSPVVQWLGLHATTTGGPGSIPGQGTKIPECCVVRPKKKKSSGAIGHITW